MKRIAITMAALLAFAGVACAANGVKSLPAKNGNVTFDHDKHRNNNPKVGACPVCHGGTDANPTKAPEGFGKDLAHKTCKSCHETKGVGPTKCGECHKK
jgi:cytochrome c553